MGEALGTTKLLILYSWDVHPTQVEQQVLITTGSE